MQRQNKKDTHVVELDSPWLTWLTPSISPPSSIRVRSLGAYNPIDASLFILRRLGQHQGRHPKRILTSHLSHWHPCLIYWRLSCRSSSVPHLNFLSIPWCMEKTYPSRAAWCWEKSQHDRFVKISCLQSHNLTPF